jgi:NAD(P)-dependent dehydrogenase (short-subunit alcohol dehydrogenase family)
MAKTSAPRGPGRDPVAGEFDGKVALVTGAGKGLGRAYARLLARLGAGVVVNNRRHGFDEPASADRTVAEIETAGGVAVAEYSDITTRGAGEALLETALAAFGRLDIVIANAGVSEGRSFHKQSMKEFRDTVETNLFGTAAVLHPAFRHFYEQRAGCLLLSTSVAGLYGEHGLPAYSASKAALLGLMYSLSQEGAPRGIRVNALAPYAATQMTAAHLKGELERRLRPDHVAPVAAWLVSDLCDISGEILIAGGGKVTRAHMMEAAGKLLERSAEDGIFAMTSRDWDELASQPLDRSYSGAIAQFRRFIANLPQYGG